jgi:CheY-like chemotaxis protein
MSTPRDLVAVFETDSSVGHLVEQTLQSEGINAVFFDLNSDFLEVVEGEKPALVLWDIKGCSRQEYEQYRLIREIPQAKNIDFILTSTNPNNFKKMFAGQPNQKVLFKPFELPDIIDCVTGELDKLEGIQKRNKEY